MKVVCAWCGKHLCGDETAIDVSHGICEECKTKTVAEFPLLMANQRDERSLDSDGERQLQI